MSKKRRRLKTPLPMGDVVLTLDVASGVGFGYGIGGKVVRYGKYASNDNEGLGQRLVKLSKWLSQLINNLPEKPSVVVVELPYLNRNPHTYAVLNRYVAVVQREVFRLLNIECAFITPRDAKNILKLPKTRNHTQQKKNAIRKINRLLGLDLKYVSGRSKKAKRSDDDTADALILLIAYWIKTGVLQDPDEASLF